MRSRFVSDLVKTAPTLVVQEDRFLDDVMKRVRVTGDEVRAAVRRHGIGAMEQVAAVVLESDGSLSVIPASRAGNRSACHGVRGVQGCE